MRAANKAATAAARQAKVDERGRRRNAARKARRLMEKKADSMPVVELRGPKQERVVDAELVDPSPHGGLVEVFQQRYLLRLIVTRQLAQMYAASLLGLLWSYIQPALRFVVYFAVFGIILRTHDSTPNFALHLFTGMVFVHYFTETWSGGTHSIWNNRTLVLKMRVPREIFPVASMVVAAYHTGPQVLILGIACALLGWHFTLVGLAAGALGMAILICFSMALSLTFSALNVFFKDFQNIVSTFTQFLHFLVPMMYSYSYIARMGQDHPWAYQLYFADPLAEAVMLMQRLFWAPTLKPSQYAHEFPPDLWERGFIMLAVCAVMLVLAQRFFSRLEGKFPERL
ncbi:ABC transporter permease [Nocardioides pocheonensis]|nr:ABC transporter permease [Nocardioides pocheonensis]